MIIQTRKTPYAESSIIISGDFACFTDKWHGDPWEAMAMADMEHAEYLRSFPDQDEEELQREADATAVMDDPFQVEPMDPSAIDQLVSRGWAPLAAPASTI